MESNRLKITPIASSFGDVAAMPASVTYAATAAGEVTDFFELPPGGELFEIGLAHAALGAGTTLSLGYRYKDPADGAAAPAAFRAATASTAVVATTIPLLDPVRFDVPVIITATLAGGAGTGKVTVTPKYRYLGTK